MKDKKLANNISLEKLSKESSKEGFNFVGNHCNWTSLEEQKLKVNEMETNSKEKNEKEKKIKLE